MTRPVGRPKKVEESDKVELIGVPEKFTFKSIYRRDKVTLRKGERAKNPDGSMRVVSPQVWAEFDHNTWTTRDPELAEILRKQIAIGDDPHSGVAPLRIVETTNL